MQPIIYKNNCTVILPVGYTANASHVIPPRIDVYQVFEKVSPTRIELRPDGELYCSKSVFNAIPTYQWGGPTGGAQGKMWKRIAGVGHDYHNRSEWELCWMGKEEPDREGLTNQRYFYTYSLPLHFITT